MWVTWGQHKVRLLNSERQSLFALEGQSKGYGVDIVISETTKVAAPDFATIELDLIQVKGKTVPVRIFALIGNNEVQSSDWFKEFNPIHAELISEYRNQNWENATSLSESATSCGREV